MELTNTKENTKKGRNMDMESTFGMTGVCMKETTLMTNVMVKENTLPLMVGAMMDNGPTT